MMYISFHLGTFMKRFVVIIPVILLFLLNACIGSGSSIGTITPTWTPTIVFPPTEDHISPVIFSELNMAIEGMVTAEPLNELEHIAGPSYQIVSVDLLPTDKIPTTLQVNVRCECAENGPCCNSTRTFVATVMTFRKIYLSGDIQKVHPYESLNILEVWCYDHANLTGVVSVPWADLADFFQGNIDGFQLWSDVIQTPVQ
jgi:hypothetical protein